MYLSLFTSMLYELIYKSRASSELDDEGLKEILEIARKYNIPQNITGCLLYHDGQFLQMLEGEHEVIQNLYQKIKHDSKHLDSVVLHMNEIKKRTFNDWSMAFKALSDDEIMQLAGVTTFKALETENEHSKESKLIFNIIAQQILQD